MAASSWASTSRCADAILALPSSNSKRMRSRLSSAWRVLLAPPPASATTTPASATPPAAVPVSAPPFPPPCPPPPFAPTPLPASAAATACPAALASAGVLPRPSAPIPTSPPKVAATMRSASRRIASGSSDASASASISEVRPEAVSRRAISSGLSRICSTCSSCASFALCSCSCARTSCAGSPLMSLAEVRPPEPLRFCACAIASRNSGGPRSSSSLSSCCARNAAAWSPEAAAICASVSLRYRCGGIALAKWSSDAGGPPGRVATSSSSSLSTMRSNFE